ncbi:MAG TPA: Fur family transcriptional regulator, partial [Gemmatimonadales bacterium]|nr:Fur family transcriptional regulator [Gemmatimonadales bacterium]
FRRHLRDHRLPVTRQRLAVAEQVFRSDDHPSVEELERRVTAAGAAVGTATLYRVLEVLVASGLVREHDFGEGFKRYEPVSSGPAHDHLVCDRCGRVEEFANDRLERLLRMTTDEHRFLYRRHRADVHGVCTDCRGRDLESLAGGTGPR